VKKKEKIKTCSDKEKKEGKWKQKKVREGEMKSKMNYSNVSK
jgi:hypothetical protein